jgi:anti-anti-sigma regulatory factor
VAAALAVADGLLERRDPGIARRLSPRERNVELVSAGLFTVVAAGMLAASSGWDDPLSAVLLTVTYALVARVRLQLGPGLVRPTQLVFVPMLFLLPAEAVPALVAVGMVASVLPEIVVGRAHPERALVAIGDSWHAIGPAVLVAALAPGDPEWADVGVYVLALVAQFAVDFASSVLREWLGGGISPRELASVLWIVYVFDALLSPIGFLAVLASGEHEYAYLLAVPPGALLALMARERGRRIEHELALGRRLRSAHLRLGEAATALDRDGLERIVLTMAVEAVEADYGRLGSGESGEPGPYAATLDLPLGDDVLTVARDRPFSDAESALLEQLAAQAAVSLENLDLQERERATAAAIRELSLPVLQVRERLLIVPLVGALDRDRAVQLTDDLLRRIPADRAQVVVIDVTGVPAIETEVASQLVHTVEACRLMGAHVVVSGMSSAITQALVLTGVNLGGIQAVADLQRGIEEAQRLLVSS